MDRIEADGRRVRVKPRRAPIDAEPVLLAIGRRGTPRKLGVPGEELPKVVYRLVDRAIRGQRCWSSAAATARSRRLSPVRAAGTRVTLAYRGEAFSRVKPKNRERLDARALAPARRAAQYRRATDPQR